MSQSEAMQQAMRELEAAMKAADTWKQDVPLPQAFMSREPFCVDTMSLPQWLRYVLLARLQALIDAGAVFPSPSSIAPAAELYLKDYPTSKRLPLIQALERIDSIMNDA